MHATDATPEAHPLYDQPDAERVLFDEAPEIPRPDASWFAAAMAGDTTVRPGWSANRAENHVMLVQLRYAEHRAARGDIDATHWASVAKRLRNDIAASNLALVLTTVVRHSHGDFEDRISHACVAVAKAIERFDPFRGFAFSTYATVAMQRALMQRVVRARRTPPCPGDDVLSQADGGRALTAYRESRREQREADQREDNAERLRAAIKAAGLTSEESHVMSQRVDGVILAVIAKALGRSKEGVRQIHGTALAKIRAAYLGKPLPVPLPKPEPAPKRAKRIGPLPTLTDVLTALADGPLMIDALCARLGLNAKQALCRLVTLSHRGKVERVGPETFAICAPQSPPPRKPPRPRPVRVRIGIPQSLNPTPLSDLGPKLPRKLPLRSSPSAQQVRSAISRRDSGLPPRPADNRYLAAVGEPQNPLRAPVPTPPPPGSRAATVLDCLHTGPCTIVELASVLGFDPTKVRSAIGHLVNLCWDVKHEGGKYSVRPQESTPPELPPRGA